jgi:hypothetical protein
MKVYLKDDGGSVILPSKRVVLLKDSSFMQCVARSCATCKTETYSTFLRKIFPF